MLEKQAKEIEARFDNGQQIFRRKSVEVLLARIQQLEIASGPTPIPADLGVERCPRCDSVLQGGYCAGCGISYAPSR